MKFSRIDLRSLLLIFRNFKRKFQLSEICLAAGIQKGRTRRKGIWKHSVSKTGTKWRMWKKKEHSFSNCQGCYHCYADIQALLSVKSNQFLGIAKENPFFIAGKESKIKPRKAGKVKDIARALYNKIDATFQKVCSTSFGEVLTKLPELQLQKRKSPTKAKREKRQIYRNYKQKVEDEWEKTSLLR